MLNLIALQADNPIVQAAWSLLLLTGAVGIVTTFVMQGIKKASMWIESAHPALKQIIVVAIGEGLAILSKFFGVALPSDLAGFDVAAVQGDDVQEVDRGAETFSEAGRVAQRVLGAL